MATEQGCDALSLSRQPRLSSQTQARAPLTREIPAVNEFEETDTIFIPAERTVTVYADKRELVPLMTLGERPELTATRLFQRQIF